jgi:hypothetical protein
MPWSDGGARAPVAGTDAGSVAPRWRRLGIAWVAVTLPVTTAVSAFADTPTSYVVVLILGAFSPYTLPGVVAGLHAVRRAAPIDRLGYRLLHAGLLVSVALGASGLVGLALGSEAVLATGAPILAVAGAALVGGLAVVVRRRSGQQALSVDVVETLAAVVAVAAPGVVLWWPDIVGAEHAWFTVMASVAFLFTVAATYWVALLRARLGPGPWGPLERWEVAAGVVAVLAGTATAALQVAQGVSGFTLPAPPLVALTALCASTYLLIPLNAPAAIRDGFAGVPPEAQVRSGWLPTAVPLAGIAALLAAIAAVADSRPWAVPFGLGVLAVLAVLTAVRQVATLRETRRLYREVEVAAGERRRLLTELLERQVDDRRSVAVHLHQQAMSAYASFATLTTAERAPGMVAQVSALVGDDLRRRAEDLHDLVQSMRSRSGAGAPGTAGPPGPGGPPAGGGAALVAPVRAFLTTLYGDRTPPRLTVTVADGLVLDWVVETVLLQVTHEALRNVRDHSGAARVDVDVFAVDGVAVLEVADGGRGFEVGATPEGDGIAVMRAAVGVIDGSLTVDAAHGRGTAVVARLGPAPGWGPGGGGRPVLRSVPRLPDPAG